MSPIRALLVTVCLMNVAVHSNDLLFYAMRHQDVGTIVGHRRVREPSGKPPATEIWVYDIQTKEKRKIYSDQSSDLNIPGFGSCSNSEVLSIAYASKTLFFVAKPVRFEGPWSIYKMPVEQNPRPQRLCGVEGDSAVAWIVASHNGCKVAYLNYSFDKKGERIVLYVHETKSGQVIGKVDLTSTVLESNIWRLGWMPDDQSLYFTLLAGCSDEMSKKAVKNIGSYTLRYDGTRPKRINKQALANPAKKKHGQTIGDPDIIGVSGDGSILCMSVVNRIVHNRSDPHSWVYWGSSSPAQKKVVAIESCAYLSNAIVSDNKKYLAFVCLGKDKGEDRPPYTSQIWIKELSADDSEFSVSQKLLWNYGEWALGLIGFETQ